MRRVRCEPSIFQLLFPFYPAVFHFFHRRCSLVGPRSFKARHVRLMLSAVFCSSAASNSGGDVLRFAALFFFFPRAFIESPVLAGGISQPPGEHLPRSSWRRYSMVNTFFFAEIRRRRYQGAGRRGAAAERSSRSLPGVDARLPAYLFPRTAHGGFTRSNPTQ